MSFLCAFSFAQKSTFFNPEELRNVKAVVGGALYILRQDYYIVDSTTKQPKKIGLNGNNYFGRYYFVAILADGKFYTDKNINTPWVLDAEFNTIKSLKKYTPKLSGLAYKQIDSIDFVAIDSIEVINKNRLTGIDSNSTYAVIPTYKRLPMLQLANNIEKLWDSTSFHWLVSAKVAKELNQNKFIDTIPTLDFDLSKGKYSVEKKSYINTGFFYNENSIVGFVFTTKPSLGKIEYLLSGMIIRNKNGKFESIPIIQKETTPVTTTPKVEVEPKLEPKKDKPVRITEIKDN
jgi:hypothetical protein